MRGHGRRRLVAGGGVLLAALALTGGTAAAQSPILENGKTKAVYDYTHAVRERVFIPQPGIDQDRNGQEDWITADIIRPAEASATNKMPAIIDPSPYYTTVCRGNESQCMADWDGDGVNDRWPLFYDNYFVPRGYAYVLGQMNGTGYTTNGCPHHGGPGDIAGEKSIVDWLNGRAPAYTAASRDSTPVLADWHNGSSAMIGKSYDGTLSNGVAATGVEGLKTIVPVSAISAWYNYSRSLGVVTSSNYPRSLNRTITYNTNAPPTITLPDRRTVPCDPINSDFNTLDGDEHGDINEFWRDRDYVKDVGKVKAAVFATHGFQDDNVKMDHEWMWWNGLKANNVPRKLWLMRTGHTDPFEVRRAEWVDTLHRWFDHWLYGVENGIMNEPAVTIEDEVGTWKNYADWPIPGTENVDVFLRGTGQDTAGTLGGTSGGDTDSVTYQQGGSTNENTLMSNPEGAQTNKRVFLSRPLTQDVRMSGTAMIDIQASLSTTQSNLGAILVDYGAGTQVSRSGEGITTDGERTCWGATGAGGPACVIGDACEASDQTIDTACYREVSRRMQDVTQWRVTRAVTDSSNRNSLWYADASPVSIDQKYRFTFPTMATEHIFKAGHQIGVILVTNLFGSSGTPGAVVTLDTKLSKVTLPIAGGYDALAAAGGTDAETVAPVLAGMPDDIVVSTANPNGIAVNYTLPTATDNEDPTPTVACSPASGSTFKIGQTVVTCTATDANGNVATDTFNVLVGGQQPVGGTVPATLALTLGAPASFGAFTPGITNTYTASTTATVISTAGDATLSVADPSSVGTGHLVNGTFVLPQPLQVAGSGLPATVKTYAAPISNDVVTLAFSQLVNANDALRTGTYTKSLTFTLSTTTP